MDDASRQDHLKPSTAPMPQAVAPRVTKTAVVVLGMHRSGTSALARVLNLLGCDLPKTPMEGGVGNQAGHWESRLIADFNDALLASAGSNWHDWLPINPGWYRSPKADDFKSQAVELLVHEYGASILFVLKDPRICRLAPFWLDAIESAGIQPALVLPIRNPLEVAASLQARNGIDPELGHVIWLRHVLDAEAASRNRPRFYCGYDGLLDAWPRLVRAMQDTIGVSFPRAPAGAAEEIDAFLAEDHRHHHETSESVIDNELLSAWIRDAFAVFDSWTRAGERQEDYATLDRVRSALDAAGPAFAKVIATGQRAMERARALEHDCARISTERDATEAGLKHANARLAEAEIRFGEKERALADTESVVRAAKDEAEWMRRVAATLLVGGERWRGRLVQLLPGFVIRMWVMRHLKRQGLFDAETYLAAHPDVARAGVNALRHYIHHGMHEGRRRQ